MGVLSVVDAKGKSKDGHSKKAKKIKLAKELSDTVGYVKAVHFHGLDQDPRSLKYNEMSSFGEAKSKGLCGVVWTVMWMLLLMWMLLHGVR